MQQTVFRRVSTRVNDFCCSLSNNAQIIVFNNICCHSGTQHYTPILTTVYFIVNDNLQLNAILKQCDSNESFKINKTRSNTNTHYAMFQSHCLNTPFM